MIFVVDASVAIKWAVDEVGRDAARQLVLEGHVLVAPDFLLLEVANIVWKKVRLRELDAVQALAVIAEIQLPISRFLPSAPLTLRALKLALELDHPAYDCLYLAAAETAGGAVVTADSRMLGLKAKGLSSSLVTGLEEFAQ
ncbi:MAG: PIN domain-containing protein [Alphaproteobacteria bacterium]|nr:MAG: PIN domain-containing protein [Alphaproteobacteria bacterium]